MLNVKNTMFDSLLSVIAPHLCCRCGAYGVLLCNNCKYDIVTHPYLGCVICERPAENGVCAEHKTAYSQAWAVGVRNGAVQTLIDMYKFQNAKAAAKDLAEVLHLYLPSFSASTVVVPIPTSRTHSRQRGYDHMYLIAKAFASLRNVPCKKLLMKTAGYTQHRANKAQRLQQSLHSFKATEAADPLKEYLLIDDVLTTGATVHNSAQALKDAGATIVRVAAIARQPLD